MSGTVIITGANGSVALGLVDHILSSYPTYTLLATVRNPSDVNSTKLSNIITSKPNAKAHVEALDLSSLADVRAFAEKTAERVKSGKLPRIKAIVCNAFTWSLSETKYTQDGIEASFQVGHLSHYLLILKLLGSMVSDGRIMLLGSNTHYPDRPHPLTKLIAKIPEDVEEIVKPLPDEPGQEHDRGFQRYGIAKLANDPNLSGITVSAMDPGNIVDSRAHAAQKPMIRLVLGTITHLLPLTKYITSSIRRSADAGKDLAELSVGKEFQGTTGYFLGVRREEEAPMTKDEGKQRVMWEACWRWAGLKEGETVLVGAAP
ncbi:hypothetical protein CEP51_013402 [Fusarium floridanum]|uniref:Ketoreductase (KR) domain-containing protein n=1 Tax=Fusarium floridanum TaxID=1325733 RepID=A0A428QC73_9HYPO|nr:hypothetical protein CEP51_013402 [Fusarium floridanum]